MNYVFEVANNLIYFTLFIYIGYYFFGFERRYRKYENVIFLGIVVILSLSWFHLEVVGKAIIHIISAIIILYLFFKESKKLLLVAFLDITCMLTMLEVMLRILTSKFCRYLEFSYDAQWGELFAKIVVFLYILCFGNYLHKSYLVNVANIQRFDKEAIYFKNGEKAMISVRKYPDLKKEYICQRFECGNG